MILTRAVSDRPIAIRKSSTLRTSGGDDRSKLRGSYLTAPIWRGVRVCAHHAGACLHSENKLQAITPPQVFVAHKCGKGYARRSPPLTWKEYLYRHNQYARWHPRLNRRITYTAVTSLQRFGRSIGTARSTTALFANHLASQASGVKKNVWRYRITSLFKEV
jgi:hypothetical protein